MKKFMLIFILFLGTFLGLTAQGVISGTILDAETGESLIGANVVIEGTATGASTDYDGKYQFEVEPGNYNLVISYIGYADKKIQNIEVTDR